MDVSHQCTLAQLLYIKSTTHWYGTKLDFLLKLPSPVRIRTFSAKPPPPPLGHVLYGRPPNGWLVFKQLNYAY